MGHDSGMIGFPLRLLARENYDRVCQIKGADKVALLTGEEKIVPKKLILLYSFRHASTYDLLPKSEKPA